MPKYSKFDLVDILSVQHIKQAYNDKITKNQQIGAELMAALQANPTAAHIFADKLGPGMICPCESCMLDKMNYFAEEIVRLKGLLGASDDMLVGSRTNGHVVGEPIPMSRPARRSAKRSK